MSHEDPREASGSYQDHDSRINLKSQSLGCSAAFAKVRHEKRVLVIIERFTLERLTNATRNRREHEEHDPQKPSDMSLRLGARFAVSASLDPVCHEDHGQDKNWQKRFKEERVIMRPV